MNAARHVVSVVGAALLIQLCAAPRVPGFSYRAGSVFWVDAGRWW